MVKKIWKVLFTLVLLISIDNSGLFVERALATEEGNTARVTLHKRVYETTPESKENTGEEDPNFGGEPLAGAEFTAYDVTETYHELIKSETTGTITEKQKAVMAKIQEAYSPTVPEEAIKVQGPIVTDDDGMAIFSDLALKEGKTDKVYVFVETKTPWQTSITEKSVPLVLAMPIYKADGTQNFDIHLYPKNVEMTDEKLFDNKNDVPKGATVSINGKEYYNVTTGDILDFELHLNIPIDIEKRTYTFADTPTDHFAYEKGSLFIAGLEAEDYVMEETELGFKVTLNTERKNVQALAGKTMVVTYQMKLTTEVLPDELENNQATVTIDGENRPSLETHLKTDPDEPEVVFGTGGKKFVKENAQTGEKLPGAEFIVKNETGEFAKFLADKNTKGEYVFERWVTTEEEASRIASNDNGSIAIIGLTNGTYSLKEVKTPSEKYVLLKSEISFVVQHGTYGDIEKIVTVENTPKGLLPSTGGSGIYIFLVVGASLMLGTYLWYRKSNQKSAK